MQNKLFNWLLLSSLAPVPQALAGQAQPPSKRLRIVYFSPNSPGNTYWPYIFEVMREVARDLNIDFVPYDLGIRRPDYSLSDAALKILEREPKPDAIITSAVMSEAKRILEKAESYHIPVFLQGPLFPHELLTIGGGPRQKYKQWVGYFHQDDFQKGYELGRHLLKKARDAKAFAADGKIHVLGIGGQQSWFGSTLRESGLKQAVADDGGAFLGQIVSTNWTIEEGREKLSRMLKRFPQTTVVWASSDTLSLAAAEVLEKNGLILGKSAFTGGLDMSALGLDNVKKGRLEATVSATPLLFAQVLVYLFDHLNGIRNDELQILPPTYKATQQNAEQFIDLIGRVRDTNFRGFSKFLNKDLKKYDFSIERLPQKFASGKEKTYRKESP